jgi:hypothetical protein
MAVLSRPHDDPQPIAPVVSPEGGKPDNIPTGQQLTEPASQTDYGEDIDLGYWIQCMDDAERAERDWRKRGREVVEIYRNDTSAGKGRSKTLETTFNILYANTEVLLGAIYQKPPTPVVRSRFASAKAVPMLPQAPPAPIMGAPMPGAPPELGGGAPSPPMPPAGAPAPTAPPTPPTPLPPAAAAPMAPPPMPGAPPPMDLAGALPPPVLPGVAGPPAGMLGAPQGPMPPDMPPGMPPAPVGMPGGLPSLQPPAGPAQKDIETAAAILEKALEIVVDDEHSHEAIKTAIKDVLLPGRGTCRVRWKPQMQTVQLPGGPLPDGTAPTEDRKIWEEIDDEYVFWEDMLLDPVRQAKDCDWMGFRHLFTEKALTAEFTGNPKFDALVAGGKLGDLLVWTDETAAKHLIGGGSAPKTAGKLGNHRRKAMVWEVWNRIDRNIIWLIRDGSGRPRQHAAAGVLPGACAHACSDDLGQPDPAHLL